MYITHTKTHKHTDTHRHTHTHNISAHFETTDLIDKTTPLNALSVYIYICIYTYTYIYICTHIITFFFLTHTLNSSANFETTELIDKTTPLNTLSLISQSLFDYRFTGDPFYAIVATKKAT